MWLRSGRLKARTPGAGKTKPVLVEEVCVTDAQDNLNLLPQGERLPGSPCGTAPFTGCRESFLKRMQFDLIYKF